MDIKDDQIDSINCEEHGKLIDIFCNECSLPICAGCLFVHKNHETIPLEKASDQAKENIIQRIFPKMKDRVKCIEEEIETIERNNNELFKQIESRQEKVKQNELKISLLKEEDKTLKIQMDSVKRALEHITPMSILDPKKYELLLTLVDSKISLSNHVKILNYQFQFQFGTQGSATGHLSYPMDVTVDQNDNIFVCDHFNHRIQIFDKNGNFLFKFGSQGQGDGQLN